MTQPVSRHDLLQINLVFSAALISIQDSKYNPRKINQISENEEILQEEAELYDQNRDVMDLEYNTPQYYSTFALCTDCDQQILIPNLVAKNLKKLFESLHQSSVIFILEFNTPWFFQQNNFAKVKEAYSYLYSLGITSDFNGGFRVDISDLEVFMEHLTWLSRCNAGMPDLYFSGINTPIIISVDRFANLLCDTYDQSFEISFRNMALDAGFGVYPWQEAIKHGFRIPCRELIVEENSAKLEELH